MRLFRKQHLNLVVQEDDADEDSESVPVERPVAVSLAESEFADLEFAEYQKASQQLSFSPPGFLRMRVERWLREQGVKVYPLPKVEAYLAAKFPARPELEGKSGFCWWPMREQDKGKLISGTANGADDVKNLIGGLVYTEKIPVHVLSLAGRIAEAFPDQLHFYIGTQRNTAREADPFLSVSANGMSMIVVAEWDEPGFRA